MQLRSRRLFPSITAALFVGVLAGVWLQHRWPLGRWGHPSAPSARVAQVAAAEIAALPASRLLVILAVGQSNAANYVATRSTGGAGVYAFHRGQLFHASDPLPGADGGRGSVWTRLGARLALSGQFDAVVLAVAARGSSAARDWAPGGRDFPLLETTLTDLQLAGLPPDFILWHQGESEGLNVIGSGADYLTAIQAVQSRCQQMFPDSTFVVAQATLHQDAPRNEQIRLAQRTAGSLPHAALGPDFDELVGDHRSDGVHFSARGASAAAERWFDTLRPLIERRAAILQSHP